MDAMHHLLDAARTTEPFDRLKSLESRQRGRSGRRDAPRGPGPAIERGAVGDAALHRP